MDLVDSLHHHYAMAKTPRASTPSQAQSGLPAVTLPTRLAGKARSTTRASGAERGEALRKDNRIDPNVSIQSLRAAQTAAAQMRSLSEVDGMVSAVLINAIATAMSGWSVQAYTTWTNETSREGLKAAETVISGLDTLWNYVQGYQDKPSMTSLVGSALYEALLTGGVGAELVLDTSRIPQGIVLFPYDTVIWKGSGKGSRIPWQKNADGIEQELNYPTLFIAEVLKPADRIYALPYMHSGVKQLLAYGGFVEDMQRVLRRNGNARTVAKLDYEKVARSAPPEAQGDPVKMAAYLDSVRAALEQVLSALEPEDAIVHYDLAELSALQSAGEKREYKDLLSELSGLTASALKSNPSALGLRVGGSQNVASTEALLAMKIAALVQNAVAEVMSRALTLAVRLYGIDAYVKFRFDDIDLRPKSELEAHLAVRQNRVLELLSLGRITDDEAQDMLGLGSLPESAEELSGTGFHKTKAPDTTPVAGTNARNQSIAPQGTSSAGGKDNEQRVK